MSIIDRIASNRPQPNGSGGVGAPQPGTWRYRMDARLTDSVPIGITPDGLRVDNSFEGHIVAGDLEGATVSGIDYYLIRPDGYGVIEARETISDGGLAISAIARGYIVPPEGFTPPPLEALLDPDLVWPDIDFGVRVFQTYQATTPEHDHLNRLAAVHLGTLNYSTGRLLIDAYELDPAGFTGTPTGR